MVSVSMGALSSSDGEREEKTKENIISDLNHFFKLEKKQQLTQWCHLHSNFESGFDL